MDVFEYLENFQSDAIKYAEKLFKNHSKTQDNPSTTIFKVIQKLIDLKR